VALNNSSIVVNAENSTRQRVFTPTFSPKRALGIRAHQWVPPSPSVRKGRFAYATDDLRIAHCSLITAHLYYGRIANVRPAYASRPLATGLSAPICSAPRCYAPQIPLQSLARPPSSHHERSKQSIAMTPIFSADKSAFQGCGGRHFRLRSRRHERSPMAQKPKPLPDEAIQHGAFSPLDCLATLAMTTPRTIAKPSHRNHSQARSHGRLATANGRFIAHCSFVHKPAHPADSPAPSPSLTHSQRRSPGSLATPKLIPLLTAHCSLLIRKPARPSTPALFSVCLNVWVLKIRIAE
jgi:hypothetical protein